MSIPSVSLESSILKRLNQHTLAGFYEEKNAPIFARTARALRRYCENAAPPIYSGTALFPNGGCNLWNLIPKQAVRYDYSSGLIGVEPTLTELANASNDTAERQILGGIVGDVRTYSVNPMSTKFKTGGGGYTHSIINYGRVLAEGLEGYRTRIEQHTRGTRGHGSRAARTERSRSESRDAPLFYNALLDALDGLIILHAKCRDAIASASSDEGRTLAVAFEQMPVKPARSFYEAMVAFNFLWYVDGTDSIGRFDQFMYPYYKADRERGAITDEEVKRLLVEFWKNMDANSGWHMILGGSDDKGKPAYNEFTDLCLETLGGFRRPNAGIRVRKDMPPAVWERVFDTINSGAGNPALYNEEAYAKSIPKFTGVKGKDASEFAYGGCTELMFHGLSNVGSLDAGINLIEVLDGTTKSSLHDSASFEDFSRRFKDDIVLNIDEMIDEVNLNQEYKLRFRPLPIRTLFIDDCIDRGVEYNAGGARYNGSVVNVGGLANAVNSLFVIQKVFDGELGVTKSSFSAMLADDWRGHDDILAQIKHLEKFGNNNRSVDALAEDIAGIVFERITARKCRRGNGFFLPACLMFVTFANEGRDVDATPDGRTRSSPIADSIGPMQGTDRDGPTSMLLSVAKLPQYKAIGTLVLNMRLPKVVFETPETREKLKTLIQTYFDLGGLQIQFTVVDEKALKDAIDHPENYESLVVRIGGYTEYFNRLTRELKEEVLKRTAHSV
ncbi:MAG: pyruvate formate lyase family protein [Spirochaetota bacterium]